LLGSREHVNFPQEMIAMSLQRPVIPTRQLDLPGKRLLSFSRACVTSSHSIQNAISIFLPPAAKLMMNRAFNTPQRDQFNFLLTNAV
jgi:hypothetical protein